MRIDLEVLRSHEAYHEIMASGELIFGREIEIDDAVANRILEGKPPIEKLVSVSVSNAMPIESWPSWALLISKDKDEGDKGVGDTAARIFGAFGGNLFKSAFKKLTGSNCGCCERQQEWNDKYQY